MPAEGRSRIRPRSEAGAVRELIYAGPHVVEWRDAPDPRVEGPRQAVVAPVAATTCDLDRGIIKGNAPFFGREFALGHELVGEVVDVGDGVRSVVPGDLVSVPAQISCGECDRCRGGDTAFCRSVRPNSMYGLGERAGGWGGGFSDLVRVPFADGMLVRLPPGVAPERVVAASDNLTNAYEAIAPHLARWPGADVLVAGVGGTGFYAVQIARALGAGEIGYLDHDAERLDFARRLGATPIDVTRDREPRALDAHYQIGADARGDPRDLALLLRSLAPRGVCTVFSLYFEEVPLPVLHMELNGLRVEFTPTSVRAHLPAVLELVHRGRLAPEAVTTETRDWEDLPEAMTEPSMKPVFVRETPAG